MNIYLVGGAVRDLLSGRTPVDRDYVVVGSTPEEMLADGFRQVGADFPVFLHPTTGEEYALARRERKTAPGHRGFSVEFGPEVTLEEDLRRRDLTINAIAMNEDGGGIVDPLGGLWDLQSGVLRACDDSAFSDDPLRVLRLARFYARIPHAVPHGRTIELARAVIQSGALEEFSAERIFLEVEKALTWRADGYQPSLFFRALRSLGALFGLFPELDALRRAVHVAKHHPEGNAFEHTMLVLDEAAKIHVEPDLSLMLSALLHDLGKGLGSPEGGPGSYPGHEKTGAELADKLLERLRCPVAVRRWVVAATRNHMKAHRWEELRAGSVLKMFRDIAATDRDLGRFLALADADIKGRALPR